MIGSTFNPRNVSDFDKACLNRNAIGIYGAATPNADTNFDYPLTDDMLLSGGSLLLVRGAAWGDKVSLHVMAGGAILFSPMVDWPVNPDACKQELPSANYPAKLVAGLTLRAVYHSVGLLTSPSVAIGYNFEKVIV